MSTPATQLPFLPHSLPKTQSEWQQALNVLQAWAGAIQQGLQQTVSVLQYGADPHGINDSTAAINSADQAATSAGVPVYFPAGTYSINVGNRLRRNGASWRGDGMFASVLKSAPAAYTVNTYLWTASNLSNFTTQDMGFDISQATFPAANVCGIALLFNSSNWIVERCAFTGIQPFTLGVYGNGGSNWSIRGNYFNMPTPATSENQAINVQQGTLQHQIIGNVCIGTGIFSNGAFGLYEGNIVTGWKFGSGITIGPFTSCQYNRVIGNYCSSGLGSPDVNGSYSAGIELWSPNSQIIGNFCYNNPGDGLRLGGGNSIVTDNQFLNNNQAQRALGGISAFSTTTANASGSIIAHNVLADNQVTPTQAWGYVEFNNVGSITGVVLAGNTFYGNVNGDMSLAGGQPGGLQIDGASIYVGTGAPSFSAKQGSMYLRQDGSSASTRAYINTTGSSTWTSITTLS